MKYAQYLLLLLPFLALSCEKDDDENPVVPESMVSATINGERWSSTIPGVPLFSSNGDNEVVTIIGAGINLTESTGTCSIVVSSNRGQTLSSRRYRSSEACLVEAEECARITFSDPDFNEYYSNLEVPTGEAVVTFTDLDTTSGGRVSGTFSGVLFDLEGNRITITDGRFEY